MPEGKYFMIRSKLNPAMVLDCEANGTSPGTRVITWEAHGGDNQQWYMCQLTGTIRSKISNLCMDASGSTLVLNSHQPGDPNQQWAADGEHVANRLDRNKVLDIAEGKTEPGATLCSWDNHGGDNQKFSFENIQPPYFYIVSEMNDKVMDVAEANPSPGTKVVMWYKKESPEDNQLWYEDRHGMIRSKLSELALDASRGSLECDNVSPGSGQMWLFQGNKIVNRNNQAEVLDIMGENDDDGAEVGLYSYHGGSNQHWRQEPFAP